MRLSIITIAIALSLLSNSHTISKPTETKININNIYAKQVQKFPDRSTQSAIAVAADKAHVEALRAAEQARIVQSTVQANKPTVVPVDNSDAKMFIYMHESGNRTTAINPGGCRGLGQACPGSKLPCGDDYACQDAYFTSYMAGRYGTWENAKAFWLQNHWW